MAKEYEALREEIDLHELSLGRVGGTLFFATQVRTTGKQLEQSVGKAKAEFNAAQSAKEMNTKIDKMADGMTELSNAMVLQRRMIGHLTGLGLSAALTNEKTDKQLQKILKGRR